MPVLDLTVANTLDLPPRFEDVVITAPVQLVLLGLLLFSIVVFRYRLFFWGTRDALASFNVGERVALPPLLRSQRRKLRRLLLPARCVCHVAGPASVSHTSLPLVDGACDKGESQSRQRASARRPSRQPRSLQRSKSWRFDPAAIAELEGRTPLLVFINPKSGGKQGEALLYVLRQLLSDCQVYDVTAEPRSAFRQLSKHSDLGKDEDVDHAKPKPGLVSLGGDNDPATMSSEKDGVGGEDGSAATSTLRKRIPRRATLPPRILKDCIEAPTTADRVGRLFGRQQQPSRTPRSHASTTTSSSSPSASNTAAANAPVSTRAQHTRATQVRLGPGPAEGLLDFKTVPRFRILVCGGDGTVGWVLDELDKLELEYRPPVGVLPLGTGNDLARHLGWGPGFTGGDICELLQRIAAAHVTLLDRWEVKILRRIHEGNSGANTDEDASTDQMRACNGGAVATETGPILVPVPQTFGGLKVMNNYFGLGVDAQIALEFHRHREAKPNAFSSRLINKLWYGRGGVKQSLLRQWADLPSVCELWVDGKLMPLPKTIEGVIVLNVPSYGGGSDLWGGEIDECISDSDDGLSETSTSPSPPWRSRKWRGEVSDGAAESESDLSQSESEGAHGSVLRAMRSRSGSDLLTVEEAIALSAPDPSDRSGVCPRSGTGTGTQRNGDGGIGRESSDEARDGPFVAPSCQDGLLEVVGVNGSAHMGMVQIGLSRAVRICQCSSLMLRTKVQVPVHIDGEPAVLPAGAEVHMSHHNQAFMLARDPVADTSVDKIVTDVLDWAMERDVIQTSQRNVLLEEIARRVQQKRDYKRRESAPETLTPFP